MRRGLAILILAAATLAYAQRGGGGGRRNNQNPGQQGGPGGQGGQTGQAGQQAQGGQAGQASAGQTTPGVTLLPGSVEGRAMSITGESLRKVSLTLRPNGRGGGSYATTSAADGSFKFAAVDQGSYALTGDRTGYVRETLSTPDGQTRLIEVVSEKNTGGIELKMTPQSVIAGHVFDEDGDPLQSVNVEVWRYTYPRGRKQLTQAQNGSTNDLGEFRIANLPPGRYFVSATARRNAALQGIQDAGRGGRGGRAAQRAGGGRAGQGEVLEDYITTYYPNLADVSGASGLDLLAGSESRGIDIRLRKTRFHHVSGSVAGLPSASAASDASDAQAKAKAKGKGADGNFFNAGGGGVILSLTPRNGGGRQVATAGMNPSDGTFEFQAVPPGSYYVVAQAPGPAQQRVTARVAVDVGNGDVNNVAVRLQPALSVSGKVIVDSTQPTVRLSSMRLTFTPSDPGPGNQGRNGQTQLADDGTFQTELSVDSYLVEAGGLPDGYYLKSVKLAGREMPDATLDLNYGVGQIDVVLAPTAGDVTGSVQNSRNEAATGVQVTVVPTVRSLRKDMNKLVTTDLNGNFTLHGLPPGDYKVFAWEEVDTNAWMDVDFRQPFENAGVAVKVDENTTPTVMLRLIERGRR